MIVRELMTVLGFSVNESGAKRYEEVFTRLKHLAITAAAAIGITELGKSIVEATSAWQQQNLQLSYIIGNTEKAHALMLKLNELAGHSPFETNELAEYSKQLIDFGFHAEEIPGLMQRMANIAAVLGKDKIPLITEALARMKQRGYADARVMMELFHAGIPIQDELAKRFGVTNFQMNRLIQEGRVGFRDVYDALTALTTGTGALAHSNDDFANSLKGRWKSVLHIIEDLKISLGTSLLPVVEDLTGRFKDWLDVNKGHLADDMIKLLNTVAYVLGWIVGRVWYLLDKLGLLPKKDDGKSGNEKPAYNEVGGKIIPGNPFDPEECRSLEEEYLGPAWTVGNLVAKGAQGIASDAKGAWGAITNLFTITVNGASGKPEDIKKAIADGVAEALKRTYRQAAPNFAEGIH